MPLVETLIQRVREGDAMLLASAAASLTAGCVVCTAIYRAWLHPLAKVPGPKHLAISDIFFQWHLFVGFDVNDFATELHRKYGSIVRAGPNRVITTGDVAWPQVHGVRAAIDGSGEFGKTQGFLFKGDEGALIGAPYHQHRRQRRQMGHAFSASALAEQEDIIMQHVNKLIAEVAKRATQGEAIDIVDWFNFCAFDIIGDLCFGESFHGLDGETSFVDNTFIALEGRSYMRFFKSYPWTKPFLQLLLGTKPMEQAIAAGKANQKLGATKGRARIEREAQGETRRDFATYMLKKNKEGERVLSDDEVAALSAILVTAGSETTATTLSGFIYLLCRPENAKQMSLVVDEVRSAFNSEDEITIQSTGHLEYLRAAQEETLRMYSPAVTITPRVSPGAEAGGYWLPKGTVVDVFTMPTHRNPAHFQEPDSFRPERWLKPSHPLYDARFEKDRKDIFKPFSAGARDCIGKNLAYAEMRLIAARLFFGFDIEILPGQENWMENQKSTLLWLKHGFKIRPSHRRSKKA